MANQDTEIEIRFPLRNSLNVAEFLDKNAQIISKNIFQKDTYYSPAHRDFLKVKYVVEWLRLRESSKGSSMTYKHFFPENSIKTDYCDEFEAKVDNVEAVKKIFQSLNFKEVVVVEKVRKVWNFEKVEIAIDDVSELGSFIEIEALENYKDPKKGKKHLYKILKVISAEVGEEDLRGYPFRLLEKRGYKFGD